jgi:hypothetical protein
MTKTVNSFEDLERLLASWSSFKDDEVYDTVGMWTLFLACLQNLRVHALGAELEDLADGLSEEQRAFLRQLAG